MRKIFHFVHQSLDGYIEGPNGEFDWPEMGPQLSAYSRELDDQVDAILYGRAVWDMMAGYWPQAESLSDHPHDLAYAPIWRAKSKLVVSSTLTDPGWNTRVLKDDVAGQLRELKQQPARDIVLMGGRQLAASLAAAHLIDEYRVVVHPVLLGGGRRLFEDGRERSKLTLVESRTFDGVSILLRYSVDGLPNPS